jgi:polar amino acid transport system substrate-binding protein
MDLDKDGLTIVALLGSAGHDWLKAHFKHAKVVGVDATNQSQGTLEVLAGRADASYNDAFVIAADIHAHPAETSNLFETNPLDVSPISWAIKRKEPDLLVFLNTMLEYMETNGTWLQYEETYKDQLGGYYHAKRNYFSVAGETSIAK